MTDPAASTPAAVSRTPRTPTGVGLGFRGPIADAMFERAGEIPWVEIHPENYVRRGGRYAAMLERAARTWPVSAHGLSMCLGNADPFDDDYLAELAALLRAVDAPWYSDHLCFGAFGNAHLLDLLPVVRTREAVDTCVARIAQLRDAVGRTVAIENVSFYAETSGSELDDLTFIHTVLREADCALMLDVNNVWVNSVNHGFDPRAFIDALPLDRVVQLHVAGHMVRPDGLIIDTHAEPVCDGVYDLVDFTLRRVGPRPVLLERDGNYPDLDVLLAEVATLQRIADDAARA